MADKTILLQRRSSTSGSLPTINNLIVGEIGLNTFDGKVFIHKSGSVNEIADVVVAGSNTRGNITILGTGSFGELNVISDLNVTGSIYVNSDIVGLGDIDITGAVTASFFKGDGRFLTAITASMRPDDFDFNSEPFAGSTGFIQGSGSLYKVATTPTVVEFRYNDVIRGTFDITNGFSGSLYGIGDVLAFSGSVASRLVAVEAGMDGGIF